MLNPKIRFRLYAAFKYFDEKEVDEKEVDEKEDLSERPATVATYININLTTVYRWEKDYKTDWKTVEDSKVRERVMKIQERVERMRDRIDKHLEEEGKSPKQFKEELQMTCGVIHLKNKASVRVLWKITAGSELSKEKVSVDVQKAIEDASAIVNVSPQKLKTELQQRIEAMTNNAMD